MEFLFKRKCGAAILRLRHKFAALLFRIQLGLIGTTMEEWRSINFAVTRALIIDEVLQELSDRLNNGEIRFEKMEVPADDSLHWN